jgi:hypothetical protein
MTAQQMFHYFVGWTCGLPVLLVGLVAFANHRQLLRRDRRVVLVRIGVGRSGGAGPRGMVRSGYASARAGASRHSSRRESFIRFERASCGSLQADGFEKSIEVAEDALVDGRADGTSLRQERRRR